MNDDIHPLSIGISIHVEDKPHVTMRKQADGTWWLNVSGDPYTYNHFAVHFESLDCADVVADAIYHARMDQDADAIQAEQSAPCKACGGIDSRGRGHRVGCMAK